MPRLTDLKDVLFPVEERPVFVTIGDPPGERRVAVPEKKAIVNRASGRVVGIVSRGYRLVSNQEALDWAFQCCRTVFPETQAGEWQVKHTDAPGTGGHCFIDLVHNSTALDFRFVPANDRPDAFGPFIRVANSYNGLRALAFDIGFYRKVCKNGLIIPDSIIRFKLPHLRRDIGETIQFEVAQERLAKFKASFGEYLGALHTCAVARPQFEPLLSAVLALPHPEGLKPNSRDARDWDALNKHVSSLCDRYAGELGENAYAVFNAITDFASHPLANRFVCRERHSLQRLAGSWLSKFSQECRAQGFDVVEYLDRLNTDRDSDAAGQTATADPSRN